MTDYFTSEHFELLSKWKETIYDKTDPEQSRAYAELKQAYRLTEDWAKAVQTAYFPAGHVDIRRRPTTQANRFARYNWARIYPSHDAPKELAYTIGINAEQYFEVKIDTVGLHGDHSVRRTYEVLRGDRNNSSPIAAYLPAADGLAMSMAQLVAWTIAAIRGFKLSYSEVAAKLNIGNASSDEDILKHFESEPKFEMSREKPINRIYYGPPGTGKTYALSRLLKQHYEQEMTSVSDEEWRSGFIAERIVPLTWWEGAVAALYQLGGSAKVGQLFDHPFIQAIAQAKGRNRNVRQTLWGTLQNHTVEHSTTVNLKARIGPAVFDKSADSVWQLAGEWRDACADLMVLVDQLKAGPQAADPLQRYSMVTFHQSYGYEEFVEGLRPVLGDDADGGEVRYEIRAGVFKELCRRARLAPTQRFAMVIDEINRGNVSKIFGELITLIEADKREGAEHALSIVLPYSGEPFSVPANVDVIGTMNTADRSLALLDTALRRRFEFVPVMPDASDEPGAPLAGLRVTLGEKVIDVPRMLRAINERIEALYDRDHCIGHAYFTALAHVADGSARLDALAQVFRHRIVPLLEEYFFEDWQKIRLVLADNQKAESAQFVTESGGHEDELARLFGPDHGQDIYGTKRRYAVQAAAFSVPDAYIGIYHTMSI
ncbi:MAG: hypothetical protein CVV14_01010 [Gammaproteobacteria bacterium HGW-Gammaproteobacteria-4]|jgi:5-methylcytosine-specific restriction protein B|nr:MAG: hypothetical protein CVV14_01010 [Gammaproteobacteria bacterium HGW-Gammaproteobacteria-4]